MSAAKHGLDNLVVLVDCNGEQSYGSTADVMPLEPFVAKWEAFGFGVIHVFDGHNVGYLKRALDLTPYESGKPSALICETLKAGWHYKGAVTAADAEENLRALA